MTKSFMFAALLSACAMPGFSMTHSSALTPSAISPSPSVPTPAPAPTGTSASAGATPTGEAKPAPAAEKYEGTALASMPDVAKALKEADLALWKITNQSATTDAELASLTRAETDCTSAVAAALGRGIAPETHVREDQEGYRSLTTIKQVCKDLHERNAEYVAKRKHEADEIAEQDAERADADRSLREAGLKGDRFKIAHEGGYRGLSNSRLTPKQLRTARYAFVLLGSDDEGYVLRRYEFEGDQIVDQRDQGFVTMPGPNAYR